MITTIHDAAYKRFNEFRNIFSATYIHLAFRMARLRCPVVVTVSEFSKSELVLLYGFVPDRIVVLTGGVSEALPEAARLDPEKLREKFEITQPYFFYIGLSRPRKNLQRLVEAFALFSQKYPGYQLVLAGPVETDFIDIDRILKDLNIKNKVVQVGFVSEAEKIGLYQGARASLLVSLYEGFGLPVLEAQQLGIPVIASNTSAIPEIAGDAALLVNPTDTAAIAAAMERMAGDETLHREFAARGLQNIRRFSWQDAASRLGMLFERVGRVQ